MDRSVPTSCHRARLGRPGATSVGEERFGAGLEHYGTDHSVPAKAFIHAVSERLEHWNTSF